MTLFPQLHNKKATITPAKLRREISEETITTLPSVNKYLMISKSISVEKEDKVAFRTRSAIPGNNTELLGIIGNLVLTEQRIIRNIRKM